MYMKVKNLVWEKISDKEFLSSKLSFGLYYEISLVELYQTYQLRLCIKLRNNQGGGKVWWGGYMCKNVEEAKKIAQKDFEERVKQCLE